MSESRTDVPRELQRAVLVEAGHRCAIPTCRHPTTEIAHIIPWAKVKEHTFDNLIALCPNCHTRYDNGEIDRKAVQQYKANLSVLNGRYGDMERRLFKHFADNPENRMVWLPFGLEILVSYMLQDGLLTHLEEQPKGYLMSQTPRFVLYQLTEKGVKFVQRWVNAESLDDLTDPGD